jgi:nucleotide-binding universal stress UspA family protein
METKNKAIKRIIAGTDFSRPARSAVIRAAMLAAERGAVLEIIHVMNRLSATGLKRLGVGDMVVQEPDPLTRQRLDEVLELARLQGVAATARVVSGRSAATLAEEADKFGADLVVVGARGERSLRDAVIGTTAERLTERCARDILIVRTTPKAPYTRILVSVALVPLSCGVVTSALVLSPQAQLHILHVYEPPLEQKLMNHGVAMTVVAEHRRAAKEEAGRGIDEVLRSCPIPPDHGPCETILKRGYPPEEILRVAARLNADLVIIGKNQSTSREFFLGSTTKHVVREASADVLVSATEN